MYQTILFDLDGTLTDSKRGITKSIQYALHHLGIAVDDLSTLEHFIGPPLRVSFSEQYGFDDATIEEALTYFHTYFVEHGIFDNEVYAGIPLLLERLTSEGKVLAVATAKPQQFAQQILEHFGLASFFDVIQGPSMETTHLDKIDLVRMALDQLPDARNNPIVMIGDRKHDMIAARENRIDSVAALYGYGSKEELENEKPTYTAKSVDALSALLMQ